MASVYPPPAPKRPKAIVSEKALYAMMNIGPKKIDKAGKMVGKPIRKRSADAKRKTKEAQSMNRDKLAAQKVSRVESKRKTGEAISIMGKKKAPSSYALGLLQSQKKKKKKGY